MPLPHSIARFNRRFTNRFLEPVARRSPGFGLITHSGRSSGRTYVTPVNLFVHRSDRVPSDERGAVRRFVVALTYGPDADWVKNVQAGQATVTTRGATSAITAVHVIARPSARPSLPRLVRLALRLLTVKDFLLLETGALEAGVEP